jgi:phosphoglycerol transferase MdoB-like AlkP superfamily enzyme
MENHGQWESHGIAIDDEIRAAAGGSGAFACYLQHLKNADCMIEALVEVLQVRERGSLFCLFGDHQPSFPDEFATLNHADMRTDYFIWKKGCAGTVTIDTEVHNLGRLLLDALCLADEEPVESRTAVGTN